MKKYNCLNCGIECNYSHHNKANKFCSNDCQQKLRRQNSFTRLLEGNIKDRGTIRSTLIYQFGKKCYECGLTEWRGHPIPLEVDHIDGNAGNNDYNNLRLVCPNCHGITPTWKGRNKGNGRSARGLPLN